MKRAIILLALTVLTVTGCRSPGPTDSNSSATSNQPTKPPWPPPAPNTMNNPPPGTVSNPANGH